MEAIKNETLESLYDLLGLSGFESAKLNQLAATDARYLRDMRINLSNALKFQTLSEKEKMLLLLAVAVNEKQTSIQEAVLKKLTALSVTEAEISETYSCVSLLNVNNVFYRFRHFAHREFYSNTPAGIKMSIMMSPVLGKEFFELMSLAVSALNGCELCVRSHEESLIAMGTNPQRIYDAIRLTAILKGSFILL